MSISPMQVEIENLSDVKRKMKIVVPAAEVDQEVDRAYRDLGRKAKVKGFRPGKVPRPVLELYYRRQVEQEVADTLVRSSLAAALKEKDLEPVSLNLPDYLPPVVVGEDYHFSVDLEVPPEFVVEDYLGLTVEDVPVEVGDELVEQRLEEIREGNAMLRSPEESREVREGDFVVLDYQAHYHGKALPEGKAENFYVEAGSGRFNADFEGRLLGLAPGAESRFAVDLPNDFANPLLAGKEVEFQVKIHEVKEKVVPELDDTFAKNLGGNFQTLADLRAAVREDIIKGKERERQALLESRVLDQILARTSFEIPPSLVRQEQETILREQFERMAQHGLDVAKLDQAKMLAAVAPMAERRVRVKLLLERIARQEGLTVDDAGLEEGLQKVAVGVGRDLEEVQRFYRENDLQESLRRQLRDEKTMKLLLDQASMVAPGSAAAQEAEAQEKE